jgi:hypothetical protein
MTFCSRSGERSKSKSKERVQEIGRDHDRAVPLLMLT